MKEESMITSNIINTAMHIHQELGPGLLDFAYQAVLVVRRREPRRAQRAQRKYT